MNIIVDIGANTEIVPEDNMSFQNVSAALNMEKHWSNDLNMKLFIYCSVILVGFILNLVVIIVYVRKLQKSTIIFSFSLAVCDLINCLYISLSILKDTDAFSVTSKRMFCVAYPFLVDSGCLISAGIVVCLAIDRFLRSKYLKYSLSRCNRLTLVAAVVISSVIITSPILLVHFATEKRFTSWERDLMCRDLSVHQTLHLKNSEGMHFSNTMLFMLELNAVILTVLVFAVVTISALYLKMTLEIRKSSFSRRPKILIQVEQRVEIKCETETLRESQFDETSIHSSEISSEGCEETVANISTKPQLTVSTVDNNENKIKNQNVNVSRRKSSMFSDVKQVTSNIVTPRFIFLILSSIILFTFYITHFALHITNICLLDQINFHHVLYKCLDHSYIVCFVLNPVIYSYFNRDFFRSFKQLFYCYKSSLNDRRRESIISSVL